MTLLLITLIHSIHKGNVRGMVLYIMLSNHMHVNGRGN